MPQAYRIKLADKQDEILRAVELHGDRAMEMFGIKDYVAWRRLLTEWTGNPNFGLHPKLPYSLTTSLEADYEAIFDRAYRQVEDRILGFIAQHDKDMERIAYLEKQLLLYKTQDDERNASKVLRLLALCERSKR